MDLSDIEGSSRETGLGARGALLFAAAIKCTRPGGRSGSPSRDEVEGFLRERVALTKV